MLRPELPDDPTQTPLSGRATAAGDPTDAAPVASGPGAAGAQPAAGRGTPSAPLMPETDGTCADCGHVHTPDGCAGDPTPSDLWAGVSVSGCDCIPIDQVSRPDSQPHEEFATRRPGDVCVCGDCKPEGER